MATNRVSLIELIVTTGLVGGPAKVIKFVISDAVGPVPFIAPTIML